MRLLGSLVVIQGDIFVFHGNNLVNERALNVFGGRLRAQVY